MTTKEILNSVEHRPWELPSDSWKFYQEWNRAIFLHYEVDFNDLKKFIPDELEIDLFEGKPWVSIVAFTMEKIRPKYLPAFPPISDFDEINIRTYVRYKGKGGVYFLSIEGGKKLSCKVAKAMSELPYRYSTINRQEGLYTSGNEVYEDKTVIDYSIGDTVKEKTQLDKWLTERYALFQDGKKGINHFEIHHLEWPVKNIHIKNLELNYPRFNDLVNSNPDKVQYSEGVKVLAWDK